MPTTSVSYVNENAVFWESLKNNLASAMIHFLILRGSDLMKLIMI